MMFNLRSIVYLLAVIVLFSCTDREKHVDKEKLAGNDFRLFQDSPVWELAKAVEDENVAAIERIIKEKGSNVNYQEGRFGKTLLMLSVVNQKYKSADALLKKGANPNLHDRYDGSSAIIDAAEQNTASEDNTLFLRLLLKYGANPSDIEVGARSKKNFSRQTPLIAACKNVNRINSPIEKVKVLVQAGANINYRNEFGTTALGTALTFDHLDVALYLLENGANYKLPVSKIEDKDLMIWESLRYSLYPLESKEYLLKLKIVAFLKEQGIDYRSVPIPEYAIQEAKRLYPSSWREYLEKY